MNASTPDLELTTLDLEMVVGGLARVWLPPGDAPALRRPRPSLPEAEPIGDDA